jgi:GNAT superfamily N-acetyltransferase
MITLHECTDLRSLRDLKAQYLESLVAPMDGMWEVGFVDSSPHFEIRMDGESAGYYAANDEGALLQFYVRPEHEAHSRVLFDHVVAQGSVTQAVASTIDPLYLSLCLDAHKSATVHTLLYELRAPVRPTHPQAEGLDFRLVAASELDRTVAFQQDCIAGGHDLSGWLRGYSANLIDRKELFALCRGDEWLGLGECRRSDTQKGIADLGMMVAPGHRGSGWATYILQRLGADSTAAGLHAICSTTVENIAAQRAIARSGFVSRHRILNVVF